MSLAMVMALEILAALALGFVIGASGKFGVMSWTARLYLLGTFVANLFKSRRRLELENLFLRHQLNIALRRAPYRLRLDG